MQPIIHVRGLTKSYGPLKAVDDLDLTVQQGTVLGLLGPNGSGKTTTVSILATLQQADAGTATIAGVDLMTSPQDVRRQIGLSGQFAAVDEYLTGFENLEMIGRLYRLGRRRAGDRARELLERLDLTDAADRPATTYSGGMRRRLDLAGAIVGNAPVIFLDEPTTGLDPQSRNTMWALVKELVAEGTTVLLTTQYLEEADQLATDIVVIDDGREIAHGSPDELKAMVGGERIELLLDTESDATTALAVLGLVAVGPPRCEGRSLSAPVDGGAASLALVLQALDAHGVDVSDVGLRRPSLDDVFLSLTGKTPPAPSGETDQTTHVDLQEVS
jgi:ABC-2 type transport system ATP-binding protein